MQINTPSISRGGGLDTNHKITSKQNTHDYAGQIKIGLNR